MWAWVQAHYLVLWALAGFVLDGVAQVLPTGPLQKLLQALAHISPAAVFSAVRSLAGSGSGSVPPTLRSVGMMALAFWMLGCTPKAQVASVDLGVCYLEQYALEPTGTPMPQVILDLVAKCGGSEGAVISLLDAHEAAAFHAVYAHLTVSQ